MPVSVTEIATTELARGRGTRCPALQPSSTVSTRSDDAAPLGELEGVREQVLDDLLQPLGVGDERRGARGARCRSGSRASWPRRRGGTCARRSRAGPSRRSSPTSTTTVPDSIFERSRMSLISASRSLPEEWIVLANSVCLWRQVAVGVPGELVGEDQQAVQRRAQLVRHVGEELRLVLGRQRELPRLLLEREAGLLDLLVLASRPRRSARPGARPSPRAAGWSAAAPPAGDWSSPASDCDCLRRSSVRVFASIVLSTMPIDSVSWSRNAWWVGLNRSNDASSRTALTWPSKRTGRTMMLAGAASPRPEEIVR